MSPWFRQDQVSYYPSRNIFSDQPVSIGQSRRLGSAGVRSDLSYVHGIHNIKVGGQISADASSANSFQLGITDPTFNAPCLTSSGDAYVGTASCTSKGLQPNPNFPAGTLPYDLTRGGQQFIFTGRTDIKQFAGYIQDQIKFHQSDREYRDSRRRVSRPGVGLIVAAAVRDLLRVQADRDRGADFLLAKL